MIKGIIFDVYGTLLMRQKTMPHWPCRVDVEHCMTHDLGISGWRTLKGLPLSEHEISELSKIIDEDLKAVLPFSDVIPTLSELHKLNIKVAIGSNLARPYLQPIKEILHTYIDEWGLSYEMSLLKPDPNFFLNICSRMQLLPHEVLVVGDTYRADILGGRAAGIQSILIDRNLTHYSKDKEILIITSLLDILAIVDNN